MPASKKKPITSTPETSTLETPSRVMPEQEDFRQHWRRLAVSAVQVLLEQTMLEELEQCLGASWGECTPTRRGYRNGSYTRDLITSTGRIEELKVIFTLFDRGVECGGHPIDLQTRRDSYTVRWNVYEFGYKMFQYSRRCMCAPELVSERTPDQCIHL